ncbi:insulinase family protein [Lonepinella sp. BR2357]|uniref:M16 family metallopeptidase n=1 Tax=Lonepinella sp. BR2357 TaxID=3434549 RepID=UPI003F6DA6BC
MQLIFSLFFLFFTLFAQAEIPQPIQGQLDNGFRYALLPLHSEKNHVEIRLKVNAGAVDETDDQTGVAHMVEHLTFRASEKYPHGIMPYLHAQQWQRGQHYNAVTNNDSTTYMFSPPHKPDLNQLFDVLSQMLFHAKITATDLDDERKIILEEWRQGQGVAERMNRLRTNTVRIDSRYTRSPVIGSQESILTMPAENLQNFYRTWYVPNNMQLLIVGDIDGEQTERFIQQYFAPIPAKTLPQRDYYEPRLSDTLRTIQLQDPQSGMSQVAYIVRFDEKYLRQQSEQGRYLRLLDRIALNLLTQRLRNQQSELPQGVNSLVVRKSEIGKNTVALGIFAGVDEQSHTQGLQQIFNEIERLKQHPFTQQDLAKQKALIQQQIDKARQANNERDFAKWVQVMQETLLADKPYYSQQELVELTEPLLQKITLDEVNRHIQRWFQQPDRIVQYQAPRLTQIEPITQEMVVNLQQKTEKMRFSEPVQEKIIPLKTFPEITQTGSIIAEKAYPEQNVIYFTLSNGDKVVWLKSELANDSTYFQTQSSAGFQGEGLGYWQSQIASQLLMQNAPRDWTEEEIQHWKKQHNINLLAKQSEQKLSFSAVVKNTHLADLLRLYYAYQQETTITQGLKDVKKQMIRHLDLTRKDTLENQQIKALTQLRYGVERTDVLPTLAELQDLNYQNLQQQWQQMRATPTTYYVLNNMEYDQIKTVIQQYLSTIPRQQALASQQTLPLTGVDRRDFAMNIAPKNDVRLWTFQPHKWQGKDAVLVSLLRQIASQKLKLSLRDKHLGVYSLRFESQLNPETQRIESELHFTANPAKTHELIKQAQQVLQHLAEQITESDVQSAKKQFIQAEKERQKSPYIWLNRLMLSDNQFNSPQYLTELNQLAENITLDNIQEMAKQIYQPNNVKVFVITQKTEK